LALQHQTVSLHYSERLTFIGDGLRAIQNGGVYVNGVQRREVKSVVDQDLFLDGKVMVIRHGRSNFRIVEALGEEEVEYDGQG
jgi:hypothetical protein